MTDPQRLPRGRHALAPEQVESIHRERLIAALAEQMLDGGYSATSIVKICRTAGVSRESFYRLYTSQLDLFLDALDAVGSVLRGRLTSAFDGPGGTVERFERAATVYLEAMVAEPGYARLFMVEVYAAGPEAIERRAVLHRDLAASFARLFGASTDHDEFDCRMLVSAISGQVAEPVVTGDHATTLALAEPLTDHVRRMLSSGSFTAAADTRP